MKNSSGENSIHKAGIEIGLYTFGELVPGRNGAPAISPRQRLQEIVTAAKLADEAGLDVFGVGEHHRLDFAVSSTPVVLAAIAQATQRIRLASAVTVLSTSDPVKVFEDFATVDLLSDGRTEIIAGRGAFVESFPLFGYELDDYHELFAEKLELLLQLNANKRITWNGSFRPALFDAEISPRPLQERLPVWIGIGGTPQSAARAGVLGTGMALAIIGGAPARFKPLVDLYRQTGTEAGHNPSDLQVAVTSHLHIQKTSRQAMDEFYPYYAHYMASSTPHRGGFQISRSDYEQLASPRGSLFVGSPQQIIEKILYEHELFGHQRFLAQIDIGGLPLSKVVSAIELLATEVAPVIRRETA